MYPYAYYTQYAPAPRPSAEGSSSTSLSTNTQVSSQAFNPGYAIAGGTVYYVYEAPDKHADLEAELNVLEQFLWYWNANDPDISRPTRYPSETAAPPRDDRLITHILCHVSTDPRYASQPAHITIDVCTEQGWNANPQWSGASVHVYPKQGKPHMGFASYQIGRDYKREYRSNVFKASLAAARLRYFGKLANGRLVDCPRII
ncbi:hypothetical protein BD626DRAFT_409659 [Schizophyllum amplum]|uniref:Uncharacterized protein n=1 Tax=Schizophyllum amplum TaxID=97359 RepID=A0A550C2T1_9AGAR|nr:hypothetical protein BD626DRAFT_409659 [Auriculariopsis ampla]